jgi:calcineurin-like phosphoesterase family protein
MDYYISSDIHLFHKNILKFYPKSRPFLSLDEMHEKFIENWNNTDILKYCGNFPICFTYIKPILNLNRSYETKINSCIDYYKNNNKLTPKSNGFFYLLFIYSDINYHDFEEKNISDLF